MNHDVGEFQWRNDLRKLDEYSWRSDVIVANVDKDENFGSINADDDNDNDDDDDDKFDVITAELHSQKGRGKRRFKTNRLQPITENGLKWAFLKRHPILVN